MHFGTAALAVGFSILILGKPVMPGHIPGDRLIANLTQRLKDEPQNADIYYSIGRAHYATFSKAVETNWSKKGEVEIYQFEEGQLPRFSTLNGNIYPWDSFKAVEDNADNRRHIEGAIKNLRIALDIKDKSPQPQTGLAHLTLACTFDCGALLAPKVKLEAPYKNLKTMSQWREMAAQEYLLAFQNSLVKDAKVTEKPMHGLRTLVAYEAGTSYLRLKPSTKDSKAVKSEIDRMMKLPPPRAITPLILDLSESKSLTSLLNPALLVNFDLDGTARTQTYGWVKSTTAFLVWDPTHEGAITSGRQLFGNATWWMLWANAYAALDALDDNRDGKLTGSELRGLALWYDRNGNGRSEAGEVIPIEQTPIASLNTSFDGRQGDSLVSTSGLTLKDGRILPTYDWVTTTVEFQKRQH